ncbi:MAG: methionine--tRNA ligase [Candidatus Bathyarchaeia archaeon]
MLARWIVCCAWPYVNTVPHLGTFIHMLSADVFARYLKMKGEEVVSVTGSDEHGTPIEVEAIKLGVKPKDITDKYHSIILNLLERYGIEFTNYTRTENPIHIRYVQEVFEKIYKNGYISTKEVTLPYCSRCERFLPDRFVEGGCPHCGFDAARGDQCDNCGRVLEPLDLVNPRCVFCKSSPEPKATRHWFFDLPKFTEKIREYLDSNPQFPPNARNFSYRWLQEGLRPRAVTRDNSWGIPAPFPSSKGKTIYVWFEAVLGYVSAVIEWSEKIGNPELWKSLWFDPEVKNVHFIGKDNIPFHTIIFPSLLMATHDPYVLPWQVSSTEFILYESQKFSKSRKVGIWIDEALELADPDTWRFVLMIMRPENKDVNFTWRDFMSHVNAELNDILGNFIYRTLSFIWKYFDGRIPRISELDEEDEKFEEEIASITVKFDNLMKELKLRDSLSLVVDLARRGNHYLSVKEPWHKINDEPEEAANSLFVSVQLVGTLAILSYPFIPAKSKEIVKQLGLDPYKYIRWENAGRESLKPGHLISEPRPLFKKIDLKDVEFFLAKRNSLRGLEFEA